MRHTKPWWIACGAIAAVVALTLSGTPGGTLAFWSETTTQAATVVAAGSITAGSAVTSSPAGAFSAGATTKTDSLTITNTGTLDAAYTTVTTASGSAPLAAGVQVAVWRSTVATGCAAPVAPVSGTWASFPALTGALAPGASQYYCVRTNLTTPVGLASPTSVTATFATTLKRSNWTSSATSTLVQTFKDDAPTTPTTLTATGTTASSTTLNWTASTDDVGVTGYDIYNGSTLIGSTTGATTYTVTGLASSTSYTFTVRAKDGAAHTSSAASVSVTTPVVNPPTGWNQLVNTKSGLCIDAKGAGTTNFAPLVQNTCGNPAQQNQTWQFDAAAVAGYYEVIPRHTTAVVWDIEASSGNNAARVILYGPHGGVNQQWNVRLVAPNTYQFMARNSGKCMSVIGGSLAVDVGYEQVPCDSTDPAQTFSFRAGAIDLTAPTAPTNLTQTAVTRNSASIRWTAATDDFAVTNYLVYRGTSLVAIATLPSSSVTYTDTTVTAGTTYQYTVRARDASGNVSTDSNRVSITTPQSLTCAAPSGTGVYPGYWLNYSWNNTIRGDSSVASYQLYINGSATSAASVGTWESTIGIGPGPAHSAAPNGSTVPVVLKKKLMNGQETTVATGSVRLSSDSSGNRLIFCG